MKIILLGYTGYGSSTLRGLLKSNDITVTSAYTKKYDFPFPYYPEKQVHDICRENGIDCYFDLNVNKMEILNRIAKENPDLIVVSSFGTLLSNKLLDLPEIGVINFHPSLLPAYRGPYPEQAVILNGEKTTGVTVHYVTEKLDSGNIIYQTEINIEDEDNFSSLKKKLSDTCEKIVPDIIGKFRDGNKPEGIIQNESKSSFHHKPSAEDCMLNNEKNILSLTNKIRALNPFPGTFFILNDRKVSVDSYQIIKLEGQNNFISESENHVDAVIDSIGIRLFKKK